MIRQRLKMEDYKLFAFIDESCFPSPKDGSPFSVLLGTCIRIEDIRHITQRVYKLKEKYYGGNPNVEIKAKNYIIPKTVNGNFSINKGFVDGLFETIESFEIEVCAIVMERPDYDPHTELGKLPIHYTFLLQRLNMCGEAINKGVSIVFDGKNPKDDEDISNTFFNFVYRSAGMEYLVEMPLFVSSKIVPGIQLADLMAGVLRHYYVNNLNNMEPQTDFQFWIHEKYKIIESKTKKYKKNGRIVQPIYLFRKDKFPRP